VLPDPAVFSVVAWFVSPEYSTLELEVLSLGFITSDVDEDVELDSEFPPFGTELIEADPPIIF
jgi:hypothetical protein